MNCHLVSPATVVLLLSSLAAPAYAQAVTIPNTTPGAVVEALKVELLPQGFQFVRANDKSALFTLDRGMVQQQGNQMVRGSLVHIVLEFTVRFKQKDGGLQVTASEEIVGNPRSSTQFRKPVESRGERDNMQVLLNNVQTALQSRPAGPDVTKKDSTP